MSRLYAIESTWSLTGAAADHRLALPPEKIEALAGEIAARLLTNDAQRVELPAPVRRFVEAMLADLKAAGSKGVLLPGATLSFDTMSAVQAANTKINAPVDRAAPLTGAPEPLGFAEFAASLERGAIENLLILDCNPAYDAAPDLYFGRLLKTVPFSVHAGQYEDETGALCHWHLPLSHPLETWSDLSAPDGTMSIVQPLIRPLYDSRSAHEILALYGGEAAPSGFDLVRETWRNGADESGFEQWWRGALVTGVASGRSPQRVSATGAGLESGIPEAPASNPVSAFPPLSGSFTAVIRSDPTVYDGRAANNAWLQECPKPLSKDTWSNVVSFAPEDASALGVENGDVVKVSSEDGDVEGPARLDKGQASGVVGLTLGYGRTSAGAIGNGLGYNARQLAPRKFSNVIPGVSVTRTGRQETIPSTQTHFQLDGELKKLLPEVMNGSGVASVASKEGPAPSLFEPSPPADPYSWAMVIDTAACTGCNACVLACQSENNIAVVGPDEVANGRIMHWLRIDSYDIGTEDEPRHGFEPVPCMQCEKAPCEPVCPVEASIHDTEGLNVQVYNRCVGTRFCQSNCPYKVRKFNWFAYNSGQEYKNLGEDPMPARNNPDVTVRARGVMEKCTYCVQRISRARRSAEKTDQPIPEGGVVTACQEACPTQAISFGNLQDKASKVNALRADPRHFALLEELGTRPRTTYLARVRNPNPELKGDDA